jgi:hypothetical protein
VGNLNVNELASLLYIGLHVGYMSTTAIPFITMATGYILIDFKVRNLSLSKTG